MVGWREIVKMVKRFQANLLREWRTSEGITLDPDHRNRNPVSESAGDPPKNIRFCRTSPEGDLCLWVGLPLAVAGLGPSAQAGATRRPAGLGPAPEIGSADGDPPFSRMGQPGPRAGMLIGWTPRRIGTRLRASLSQSAECARRRRVHDVAGASHIGDPDAARSPAPAAPCLAGLPSKCRFEGEWNE